MKSILVWILMLLTSEVVTAQVALIQAPGSTPTGYFQFLKEHPNYISYSDFTHRRLQKNDAQEAKFFKLGDSFDQDLGLTLLHLKGLQQDAPLTLLSLRYMRDLTFKALSSGALSAADRRDLVHLHCKSVNLLNEGPSNEKCDADIINMSSLRRRFSQAEKIMIETTLYGLSQEESVPLSPRTAYHWTLLANSQKPIHFYGTYQQLLQQNFLFANAVEGGCEGFTTAVEEFNALSSAQIYFSETCQKVSHSLPADKSWAERNKPWLYTAGAVALGVLIYSMKDKKMVINTNGAQ